jgi:hypothetical protein
MPSESNFSKHLTSFSILVALLKNLKLGCVSSKDSSDADAIDIDNIPDTLTDKQVRVVINGFGEVLGEVLINTISAAAD